MDDDDLRRGTPDEPQGLRRGDWRSSRATRSTRSRSSRCSRASRRPGARARARARASRARRACDGMVGGQVEDLAAEGAARRGGRASSASTAARPPRCSRPPARAAVAPAAATPRRVDALRALRHSSSASPSRSSTTSSTRPAPPESLGKTPGKDRARRQDDLRRARGRPRGARARAAGRLDRALSSRSRALPRPEALAALARYVVERDADRRRTADPSATTTRSTAPPASEGRRGPSRSARRAPKSSCPTGERERERERPQRHHAPADRVGDGELDRRVPRREERDHREARDDARARTRRRTAGKSPITTSESANTPSARRSRRGAAAPAGRRPTRRRDTAPTPLDE